MNNLASQPLPITLTELESHLSEAANILSGSPVDRTDWKSYILPLLFFKRVCDVWDEDHAAILTEYGKDFADEHCFQVTEGCHWSNVRSAQKNVGKSLSNAMRCIETGNQKHLHGVFGDALWTNKNRLPDDLIKDLIEHFSVLSLGNARIASDIFGDTYEHLIKRFANGTNKKAGEFYHAASAVTIGNKMASSTSKQVFAPSQHELVAGLYAEMVCLSSTSSKSATVRFTSRHL